LGTLFFVVGRDLLNSTFPELQVIVFGVLFILVVLVLPGGFVEGGRKLFGLVTRGAANPPTDRAGNDPADTEGKERV
jgi:hypothetical protein